MPNKFDEDDYYDYDYDDEYDDGYDDYGDDAVETKPKAAKQVCCGDHAALCCCSQSSA